MIGEVDPRGLTVHEPGAKLDQGKPEYHRVLRDFPRAFEHVAKVAQYGAEKYSEGGWRHVQEGQTRYTNALIRHVVLEGKEGTFDKDSNMLHAAHAAWNALARLELLLTNAGGESWFQAALDKGDAHD